MINPDNRLTTIYFIKFYISKFIRSFFKLSKERNYSSRLNKFLKLKKTLNNKNKKEKILLICLDNFEKYFLYVWLVCINKLSNKYGIKIVSSKNNFIINKIAKLLDLELIIFDKIQDQEIDNTLKYKIKKLQNFENFINFKYDKFEIGKMVISNYCRLHRVGFINYNSLLQRKILQSMIYGFLKKYLAILNSELFKDTKIVFTFEKNLFPYLHFYLFAIKKKYNLVHWAGGNLNEKSFLLRKYNMKNIYLHHSTVSDKNWKLKKVKFNKKILLFNKKILNKRYSGDFSTFSVNLIKCKKNINLKIPQQNKKKNCIIFSHILHDQLYFFGDDIYESYSDWLINTVKLAMKNKNVNWYVKFHPSNIYRGEFKLGKSKEEDILRQHIYTLPNHVKFIYPDTVYSPIEWMKFADIGVTVRGTSGLEMAMLGKPVITCGANRYEDKGFSYDPKNVAQYEKYIKNIHKLSTKKNQIENSNLFFYYLFKAKPFTADFIKTNYSGNFSWYKVDFNTHKNFQNSKNIKKFTKFIENSKQTEYLNI